MISLLRTSNTLVSPPFLPLTRHAYQYSTYLSTITQHVLLLICLLDILFYYQPGNTMAIHNGPI